MKRINIIYWSITGLFAAFMVFSSLGNIVSDQQSVDFLSGKLGYPTYIIPFLGVAKVLGVIAILIPGFARIKEWAYAGLCFDLLGATFSVISVEGLQAGTAFMLLPFAFLAGSYIYHHKRLAAATDATGTASRVAVA